jgi:hypothetical protein
LCFLEKPARIALFGNRANAQHDPDRDPGQGREKPGGGYV